jgi:hypothetical protein
MESSHSKPELGIELIIESSHSKPELGIELGIESSYSKPELGIELWRGAGLECQLSLGLTWQLYLTL